MYNTSDINSIGHNYNISNTISIGNYKWQVHLLYSNTCSNIINNSSSLSIIDISDTTFSKLTLKQKSET